MGELDLTITAARKISLAERFDRPTLCFCWGVLNAKTADSMLFWRNQVAASRQQEDGMAKYMWTGSYTAQGTKGVIAEGGSSRKAVVEKMLASVGGKLECLYFALGSDDVVIIVDAPDNISAAAIGLTVAASGAVQGRLTVLLTPEEIDQAAKKSPAYRPPGA